MTLYIRVKKYNLYGSCIGGFKHLELIIKFITLKTTTAHKKANSPKEASVSHFSIFTGI